MGNKGRRALGEGMVTIQLECEKRHTVATVFMTTPPNPNPGDMRVSGAIVSEGPTGEKKIAGSCTMCSSKPQWRWERVKSAAHIAEVSGERETRLSP